MTTDTVRLTVAQALVTYLSRQYSVADGQRRRLIPAALGIFGHGNVAGLGQALDQLSDALPFIQGRNEQALVHVATAYRQGVAAPRHPRRHRLYRPGRAQHGHRRRTGHRQPPARSCCCPATPTRPAGRARSCSSSSTRSRPTPASTTPSGPVSRFFDRITRPEQLLTALPAGHAGAHRPGRHRRRRARPSPRTSSRTPTTTRPSSSPSATGPSAAHCPTRTRSRRWRSCSPRPNGR